MTYLSSQQSAVTQVNDPGAQASREESLTFESLDFARLLPALSIAKDSFPAPDMAQIVREYRAVAHKDGSFYEPSLAQEIQVIDDVVAYFDKAPAGIAGVYRCGQDTDTLWLSWFAVRDDLRGNGIGQQILDYCEGVALKNGARVFAAYTEDAPSNANCHRLYEKCGYVPTRVIEVDGHSMRVYEKKLDVNQDRGERGCDGV